ncbi:MAG: hypothetical protein H0W61_09570 [Bacteroidetes bacterium]|nr:hypothetical protein [Bacteroidota bacterium]
MKIFLIIFFFFFYLLPSFGQELRFEDGIFIEKKNHNNHNIFAYSEDNISYKLFEKFIFDYYFLDKTGFKRKFLKTDSIGLKNPMNLANDGDVSENVIQKIELSVDDGLGSYFRPDSNYTQTLIRYRYLSIENENVVPDEITGLIDNRKNIWLHPPLSFSFKILQFNPFPFYVLDESIKEWSYSREVGDFYLDERWTKEKRNINIKFRYKRTFDEILKTPLGNLKCKVVESYGEAIDGEYFFKTKLKSFYNNKYGFVLLEYTNIDGTRLIIRLSEKKVLPKVFSKAEKLIEYDQQCCQPYFTEKLALRIDSTFTYFYSDNSLKEEYSGRWKISKDTLLLYDYSHEVLTNKLNGIESYDASLKDSIEISFLDPITSKYVLPEFFINGKCSKSCVNGQLSCRIPMEVVKRITIKGGEYIVRDYKTNRFLIYYMFNWNAVQLTRVQNLSKCLIRDTCLQRVDCDGSLDKIYHLKKKIKAK